MKALSLLLPALWAIFALTQPASAQSNPLLILTEAQYNIYTKTTLNSLPFTCPNHTNASCNCIVNAWKAIIGKSTDNSITTITQEKANKYLQELFVNKGLLEDVKNLNLRHWHKDSWDNILSKRAIVLRTTGSDPNNPSFVAASSCYDHKKNWHQILIVNVTKMAKKERGCFNDANTNNTDGGLKSSDASLRTTLVHEMGHQYLLANYPDLHLHPDNDKIGKLINGVRYSVHEAFAVYTEYLYLKKLASENKITPFTFRDFVEDTIKDIESESKQQPYLSKYGVSPDYMLQFITGLDNIRGKDDIDNYRILPFNYNLLEQASAECKKWASKKSVPQTTYTYHFVNTSTAGYPATGAITYTLYQSTPDHMASLRLSKSPQDLAEIEKVFNNINNSQNKPTDPLKQRKWEREEHEKVEHLIRKKNFEIILDYLSKNQCFNIDVPLIR